MDWSQTFEAIGKLVSGAAAVGGGWWAFVKWRKRDELFPRVEFEVTARFIGIQDGKMVTEIVATLENKGVVPLKIKHFSFKLRGLAAGDSLTKGGEKIRGQLDFQRLLDEGLLVPEKWEYTFVYPGVKTEYNFVTAIPETTTFVRVQADFEYLRNGESHHAARILKMEPLRNILR